MDKKDKEVYQKEMARLEKDLVILEDEYYEGNYVKRAVMSKEIEGI